MFDFQNIPPLNLDQKAIETANGLSMYNAGTNIAHDATITYQSGFDAFTADYPASVWNDQQKAVAESRAAEWKELCEKSYNDVIRRRASWVPWTVSGPANYDSKRNSAKADAQMNAEKEWHEKRERFLENTREMIRNALPLEDVLTEYRCGLRTDTISSDDPAAVEKLRARVDYLKKYHENGKLMNAYYRKNGTMKGFPGLDPTRAECVNDRLAGGRGLPYCGGEYVTADIRRLEKRILEIKTLREKAETAPDGGETKREFDGFTVQESVKDQRIYIFFDEKPDEETRNILKHNGFRWSPKNKVWQRQYTDNALYSLNKYVIPGLLKGGKTDG